MELKHFSKLRKGKFNWMVPTNIQAMMSGATSASQSKDGTITLHYSDGTTESRVSEKDLCTEFDGWFVVVSYVQSARI